jgi:hypothetical protein
VVEDAVRIEPLTKTDVASAVQLAVRVLRVRPGDRGEQFALDITRRKFWRPCCFNLSACTDPDLSKNGRLLEPGDDRP